jgi:hypothetical protein
MAITWAARFDRDVRLVSYFLRITVLEEFMMADSKSKNRAAIAASRGKSPLQIHCVSEIGWVHTHGMCALGLPELEVRHVPGFLWEDAGRLLRHVCDYMISTGTRIRAGETMDTSPRTRFRFITPRPIPGEDDHYNVEYLQIADVEPLCECCRPQQSGSN